MEKAKKIFKGLFSGSSFRTSDEAEDTQDDESAQSSLASIKERSRSFLLRQRSRVVPEIAHNSQQLQASAVLTQGREDNTMVSSKASHCHNQFSTSARE